MIGPMHPMAMLNRMAGFLRDAQWMYCKGVDQKETGAMM